MVTKLMHGIGSRNAVHQVLAVGAMGADGRNEAFFRVESLNIEETGNLFWDSVRPPAVAVNETRKPVNFRLKAVVGGVRAGGMIFALQRVTKDDDELNGWIGDDA